MEAEQRIWTRRLRWRLRGAWQWPAFAVMTLLDALIIHLLPPVRLGVDPFFALIVASFGNLLLVGVVAPFVAGRLVERERGARRAGAGGLPDEVILDRTATALLVGGALGLVAAGLAARPVVVSETEATEANARAVQEYVERHGSEEMRRNLETANTIRLGEGYFRTCIAADDRRRAFCLLVETTQRPPRLVPDPSTVPNAPMSRGR